MTTIRILSVGLVLAIVGATHAQTSQTKPASAGSKDPDIAAIQKSAETFQSAFNKGDAKAVAAHWTKNGEYIAENGEIFQEQQEIEKSYAVFFNSRPGATIQIKIGSIRLLSPSAAVEDGRVKLTEASGVRSTEARYSALHVKEDGKWRMASVRDEPLQTHGPMGVLADLEWLIGTWTANNRGVVLNTTFKWIAGKSFIEQSFTGTKGDRIISSGKQIIGFDPLRNCITSWTFTSDGGHAVGRWSPLETGWQVETDGIMLDGTPTTAVNILSRLDDQAMAWRSVNRTAASYRILDSEEVILRRVPAKDSKK